MRTPIPGLLSIVNNLGEIDAREINSIPITDEITLRVGKFGPYLESSAATVDAKTGEVVENSRANVPEDLAPDELTAAKAIELMETARRKNASWAPIRTPATPWWPRTAATAPTSPRSSRR